MRISSRSSCNIFVHVLCGLVVPCIIVYCNNCTCKRKECASLASVLVCRGVLLPYPTLCTFLSHVASSCATVHPHPSQNPYRNRHIRVVMLGLRNSISRVDVRNHYIHTEFSNCHHSIVRTYTGYWERIGNI